MSTRGKKLVALALSETIATSNIEQDGKFDVYNNIEEDNLEYPWIMYDKWREEHRQLPKRVTIAEVDDNSENLEITSLHELQPLQTDPKITKKLLNTTDFKVSDTAETGHARSFESSSGNSVLSNSSISWKPNEGSNESSTSGSSEVFDNILPINCNVSDIFNCEPDIRDSVLKKSIAHQRDPEPLQLLDCNIQHNPVEHSLRKGRVWNKKDRCTYCNRDITNFSRHLFRNHTNEESVKQILEKPKGDRNRKFMIDLLRKQGNFSIIGENITRPVQRPTSKPNEDTVLPTDYLPCKYCKGLYKKRSLRRHALSCFFNNDNKEKTHFASEGQTMIAFTESRQDFLKKLRLKSEVFNTMHADRISLNGKSDPIICQYAEDYLRKHRRPHIRSAVSNKVRELGRLLIPLQDIYNINSMMEVMKPEHFDKVVSASRIISGYDEALRTFRAPSLALHLKTILLATCSSAKTLLLKKSSVLGITDYETALKNLKGFRELVDMNWKFEMGSLALKDLNEKQSVNPQKLPITQDIIAFKNYTQNIADACMESLKENPKDLNSFKQLTEAALALTIILNRKRIGDVQYTKLEYYTRNLTDNNQEECLNSLEESERELSKHFKRIVTVGKGSKPIAILISKKVQEYIETILSVRKLSAFVPIENPYLFALTKSSSKWVDGSTVLRKFATKCGAKNPNTLTSSRLRKQIATVLQILNLNDSEMEQVATFMGHTKKTHEQFYRLPQEIFQTAKIAKLLIMMEKGVGSESQGKTLKEIDVELESWYRQSPKEKHISDSNDDESDASNELESLGQLETLSKANNSKIGDTLNDKPDHLANKINNTTESESDEEPLETIKNKNKLKKSNSRGSWNEEQKSIMIKYFKNHIKNKISPKKGECLKMREKHLSLFRDKTWLQIKVFVYNMYKNK